MSKPIPESELILNDDGSIYHLGICPGQLPQLIFLVGDPQRVEKVSVHFDAIHTRIEKREFKTHIGTLNQKEVAVISTGIGTDNMDIVLNEINMLFSVDFAKRQWKTRETPVRLIRLGTSGSIRRDLPLDSVVYSEEAYGLDGLAWYYGNKLEWMDEAFVKRLHWPENCNRPYRVKCSRLLAGELPNTISPVTTLTCPGFYKPQGRMLGERDSFLDITNFANAGIHNLEMETSGLYLFSKLFGFEALSLNAILANRALGTFSKEAEKSINRMIEIGLSAYTR